jgi:hypothetical protein
MDPAPTIPQRMVLTPTRHNRQKMGTGYIFIFEILLWVAALARPAQRRDVAARIAEMKM